MGVVEKLDTLQRRRKPLALGVAAFKKFKEDQSTNLAAMIAFWAFFSIFPLFMVLITILGWVLPASDKDRVLTHVANLFPLLNPSTLHGLTGSWWALIVGLLSALWSGVGVVRTVQTALDSVWEIPMHARAGLKEQVLRSLGILGTLGVGLVISTLISGFVTGSSTGLRLGVAGRVAGLLIAIVLDVGLFVAAFRMLTDREIAASDVLPGAVFSGVVFFILTELSSFIISRHLKSAQSTYGTFATVITILWWFYLQGVVTMLGAQINVVLKDGFYPRSLTGAPETEADRRALQAYAEERKYHPQEQLQTGMTAPPQP